MTQRAVSVPATLASPGCLLEMQDWGTSGSVTVLLNQNLHFNKMSRWLTCTRNFRMHCTRPSDHQVNRAPNPVQQLLMVVQLPQFSSDVGRAFILQGHWSSRLQPETACPLSLEHHTNTGLNFPHRKRLCAFHVLSAWERLKQVPFQPKEWSWTCVRNTNSIL